MGASVLKREGSGNGTITEMYTVPTGDTYRLISVSCVFATAPTTSEDLTIEIDCIAGPAFDVRLYAVDPSAAATTDIFWQPDEEIFLEGGDTLNIDYPGTDLRSWGLQATFKVVP